MSLRRRLILTIGGLVVSLLVVLELLGYYGARAFALYELEQEGGLLARYQAERVRASLGYAEMASEFLLSALQFSQSRSDTGELKRRLEHLLNGNTQISAVEVYGLPTEAIALRRTVDGSIVASEASFYPRRIGDWSLQEQTEGRWIVPVSDPKATSLYHAQKANGVTVVLEVPVRLLAAPLEQSEGAVAYGFLASGAVVLFTNPAALKPSEAHQSFISDILMERGKDCEFFPITDPVYGQKAWVGTAPVGDLELTVGVVYLEGESFRPLYGLAWSTLVVGAVGVVVLLLAVSLTSRSVAKPLVELAQAVENASSHGFTQRVATPSNATLEVERLTLSCNRMLDGLAHYIGQLEEAAQDRQAMESELAIAAEIQNSMLPKFPFQTSHCLAAGFSFPAQKVGGDFINIFPIGADRIGFFIGDVSGKGIPGAITMAFTASLLEHLGRAGLPAQECFSAVNRALCAREESTSFVTAFFGVIGRDRTVSYANAGHHLPILFCEDGRARSPEIDSGLALGVYPEAVFATGQFRLEERERMLLYTDGVTEAMNGVREEYGEERLWHLVSALRAEQTPHQQLEQLQVDIELFRAGSVPNDDTTAMLLFVP